MKINRNAQTYGVFVLLKHSGVPTMMSLPSTKIKFSTDKIYYKFSSGVSKISNM